MSELNLEGVDGFEWDRGNRPKVEKRMPAVMAESAFLGEPLVWYDVNHSGDEPRWFLMNRVGDRPLFLALTLRGNKIRVISARFMHEKEAKKYDGKIA